MRGRFQQDYASVLLDPLSRPFVDAADHLYTDAASRRRAGAYWPFPREFADMEDARSYAWAGDPRGVQDFRMHGGL